MGHYNREMRLDWVKVSNPFDVRPTTNEVHIKYVWLSNSGRVMYT